MFKEMLTENDDTSLKSIIKNAEYDIKKMNFKKQNFVLQFEVGDRAYEYDIEAKSYDDAIRKLNNIIKAKEFSSAKGYTTDIENKAVVDTHIKLKDVNDLTYEIY